MLETNSSKLYLNYSDDGIGFDTKQAQFKKGLGLKNIESRVELLNGKLKINSENESGATFIIHI